MNRRKMLLLTGGAVVASASSTAHAGDDGAVGDGATDDTGALQAQLDAACETGGTVLLAAGTYLITDSLFIDLPDGEVTLLGDGESATVLRIEASDESAPAIYVGGAEADAPARVRIIGLRIESGAAPDEPTLVGETGIRVESVGRMVFEDVGPFRGDAPSTRGRTVEDISC